MPISNEKRRKYYALNRERYRSYQRSQREKDPERYRGYEYRKLLNNQEPPRPRPDCCEACGRPPGTRRICLDHDHVTGKFRGWLCSKCNLALGHLADSEEYLLGLLTYLRQSRS